MSAPVTAEVNTGEQGQCNEWQAIKALRFLVAVLTIEELIREGLNEKKRFLSGIARIT